MKRIMIKTCGTISAKTQYMKKEKLSETIPLKKPVKHARKHKHPHKRVERIIILIITMDKAETICLAELYIDASTMANTRYPIENIKYTPVLN